MTTKLKKTLSVELAFLSELMKFDIVCLRGKGILEKVLTSLGLSKDWQPTDPCLKRLMVSTDPQVLHYCVNCLMMWLASRSDTFSPDEESLSESEKLIFRELIDELPSMITTEKDNYAFTSTVDTELRVELSEFVRCNYQHELGDARVDGLASFEFDEKGEMK